MTAVHGNARQFYTLEVDTSNSDDTLAGFVMQIKFNFIFCGVRLIQLGSVPAAYAVVAGGCDWPIQ